MLGIVIPTLNAEDTLAKTLKNAALNRAPLKEPVVVDGGSTDQTRQIAADLGVRVIETAPGRGRQLAAGAQHVLDQGAKWILFLHADCSLPAGWGEQVADFAISEKNYWRIGYFQLGLDAPSPNARRVEKWANWRANKLGLPYGDQGLLISADLYEIVGGFNPDLDLMEDVDLINRLKKTPGVQLVPFDGKIITSSKRYQSDGWWQRPLQNLLCLALFYIGTPQGLLKRLYQ